MVLLISNSALDDPKIMVVNATDSDELISFESESLNLVSDGAALLDWFELRIRRDELVSGGVVLIVGHSDLLHVALDGTTVHFDALFVDGLDNSIQNLLITWFECNDIESDVEDDISCSVLNHSF